MEPKNNQEKKKDIAAFWKKVLFHNLSIKILSFLGALLVWLFIVNIDDPYKTKSYMVHVDLTNEDALRSVHKVYEIVEGGTATVRVRGRRSVVDNLDASGIKATADLSEAVFKDSNFFGCRTGMYTGIKSVSGRYGDKAGQSYG